MSGVIESPADSRPRVLYVVSDPMTAVVLLRDQLRFLREDGFEVGVIASPGSPLEEVSRRDGVWTRGVPIAWEIRPISDLISLFRLWRAIRKWRPDLVNSSTTKAGLLGTLAARFARVRMRVYTLRGLRLETARGWKRRLFRLTEKLASGSAHRVICVSESLRSAYLRQGLCKPSKAKVLGKGSSGGVDVERFRPAAPDEARLTELRRSLGIPPAAPVVGYVGRFSMDKGVTDLVEAFLGSIGKTVPQTRLLVIGSTSHVAPSDVALLNRLVDDPRVIRTGFVADPELYYRLMDVLALPSYREGFPNAILEAAATGVPAVAYAATGSVDAIVDGQTGTLVPVGELGELARAMCVYLEDPDLRHRHGRSARERTQRHFRRAEVCRAWAREYRRLLSSGA